MLDDPAFSCLNEYTVVLNGTEIWIDNYPYACCNRHIRTKPGQGYIPKRSTVYRFFDELKKSGLRDQDIKEVCNI